MADRRVQRTRNALVGAFNALVLGGRRGRIGVAEVVQGAGVGRSTFYDHYSGVEALHLDALRGPLSLLAEAAVGEGDEAALGRLLDHFWEFRHRARESFGEPAERLLAGLIEDRLGARSLTVPTRIAARQLAAGVLATVRVWVKGEAWCPADELAAAIHRSGRAQVAALEG